MLSELNHSFVSNEEEKEEKNRLIEMIKKLQTEIEKVEQIPSKRSEEKDDTEPN